MKTNKLKFQFIQHYIITLGLIISLLISFNIEAKSTDNVISNPKSQVTKDTCQSYSIALSLLVILNESSSSSSYKLRELELVMRNIITTMPKGIDEGNTSHVVWERAVKQYSQQYYEKQHPNKVLVLKRRFIKNKENFYKEVRRLTNIDYVDVVGAETAAYMTKVPVMTSTKFIEGKPYRNGHIVTIFGMRDAGESLLVMNSATNKTSETLKFCDSSWGGTRLPYSAQFSSGDKIYDPLLSEIADYDLTEFFLWLVCFFSFYEINDSEIPVIINFRKSYKNRFNSVFVIW